ncbi:hypothetical protein E2542_SST12520 [Spatholobus suberectus]|nr:hypothetical protein E2542_SST12520 [Spatholobus suberectus]
MTLGELNGEDATWSDAEAEIQNDMRKSGCNNAYMLMTLNAYQTMLMLYCYRTSADDGENDPEKA